MAYKFGKRSLEHLSTCHKDLQLIAHEALKRSMVDFGIHCGWRSNEDQQKAYDSGHSSAPPGSSKHNLKPAMAFDFHIYVRGKANRTWDEIHVVYVATVILETARELKSKGLISHNVRWGGNWDGDGEIKYDQRLWDPVHIELV